MKTLILRMGGLMLLIVAMGRLNASGPTPRAISASTGFVENKGQIVDLNGHHNPAALFLLSMEGMNIQLRQGGFSYDSYVVEHAKAAGIVQGGPALSFSEPSPEGNHRSFHRVDVDFVGSNPAAKVKAEVPLPVQWHYYTPTVQPGGIIDVSSYPRVLYEGIYPLIDVEFLILADGQFKYNFIVHPGADLHAIRLHYSGAENFLSDDRKGIQVKLSSGTLEDRLPFSYSAYPGYHEPVEVVYMDYEDDTYGMEAVTAYDLGQDLVIDPQPLQVWGSYFGDGDGAFCTAKDVSGDVFVGGNTDGNTQIATTGTHQQTQNGFSSDGYLAKFDSLGQLIWGTYYGGNSSDWVNGVATDSVGQVYVGGTTYSSLGMSTIGVHQETPGGGSIDAFAAKFDSSGHRVWASYYGGSDWDYGLSMAVGSPNAIYLAGYTRSVNGIGSANGHQPADGGNGQYDAYLVRFDSLGARLWGTYYGGTNDDYSTCVHVNRSGEVFLGGSTLSTTAIGTAGSYRSTHYPGVTNSDGFLAKFYANGTRVWGTYYGSANFGDGISAVTTDINDNIIMVGATGLNAAGAWGQIATAGAAQGTSGGGQSDCFVAKFTPGGSRTWGTFWGGNDIDGANAVVADSFGGIIVGGETRSTNFPTSPGAFQPSYGGGTTDAFLFKLASGGQLRWSTHYGGIGFDEGYGLSTDLRGFVYYVGHTSSAYGIATVGAYRVARGPNEDGFISCFQDCDTLPTPLAMTMPAQLCPNQQGVTISVPHVIAANLYEWIVPLGWTIVAGQGTRSIVVNVGTVSDSVKVRAVNGCRFSKYRRRMVVLLPLPSPSGPITGPDHVCIGQSGVQYSVGTIAAATSYVWTTPAGATIVSGNGTNAVTIDFGSMPGIVSVTGSNGCGTGDTSTLTIVIDSVAPLAPIAIMGDTAICANQSGLVYAINPVNGANNYLWTVTGGYSIVSGQGSASILVNAGSIAGTVSVSSANGCGNSPPLSLGISIVAIPAQPGSIMGATTVNAGQTNLSYSVTPVSGATSYLWTVPAGATILSGQGTSSILINFGSQGGNVTVIAIGTCGMSPVQALGVTIFIPVGLADQTRAVWSQVRPNPSSGKFVLDVDIQESGIYAWQVVDNLGKVVLHGERFLEKGVHLEDLELSVAGIYFLTLSGQGFFTHHSIIIQ